MDIIIQRAAVLKPLQLVHGVVERRHTLPILANVLLTIKEGHLSLTATDMEIEMVGRALVETVSVDGAVTVSARKLLDICRALPEDAQLNCLLEGDHLIVRAHKSRFSLATLPAKDFPSSEDATFKTQFTIKQSELKKILSQVHFAMGQQDVRHYLNGVLFDINQGVAKCVATDGHRLACGTVSSDTLASVQARVILPRKSVLELMRLLDNNSEEEVTVCLSDNHFRAITSDVVFTSKLINGQYPDYEKLIPRRILHTVLADREGFKQALTRASILTNEKFRGVRLQLSDDLLRIVANNPEQEEAEEVLPLKYQGNAVEMGFNVAYLLDVLGALDSEHIRWSFSDPDGGILLENPEGDGGLYVVMPLRL